HVTEVRDGRARVLTGYGRLVGGDEPPGGQWGFIDPTGKRVIQTGVSFGSEFSEGLAPATLEIDNPGRDFIDRDGKLALTVNPDLGSKQAFVATVGAFSEGMLAVNGTVVEKRRTRSVA